jgi:hypothetical protein
VITDAVDQTTGKIISLPDQPSVLGNILTFANKNQLVAFGALQAGGSLLSGLTSTLTPAQVTALNAQGAANDAAAALQKQQTANLAPVTGTPATLVPQTQPQPTQSAATPGLINQAPQQPSVTGVPA